MLQEIITMSVFAVFVVAYMYASVRLVAAAYFMFRGTGILSIR